MASPQGPRQRAPRGRRAALAGGVSVDGAALVWRSPEGPPRGGGEPLGADPGAPGGEGHGMRTGWTVIALLVLGAGSAIYFFGSRAEKASAAADRRRTYMTTLFVREAKDRVASMGSKGLGAAAYAKASAEYATARSEASEAERGYIEACRQCAPAAECERDRLVIASGRATDNYNPCEQ